MTEERTDQQDLAPEFMAKLDKLKDALLVVLLRRLGGDLIISTEEIDDIEHDIWIDPLPDVVSGDGAIRFHLVRKTL